ncbi:FAD-dependent monooxygenase [Nocardia alba]|uniref:2-polyprenyl-6-methoxyphenol hydroxylase-like FAD-dependent oxidoreductase n=1 Tax=Nocardia alba TaxID=225051 RepID=A0A4R1FFN4_9NOCA|nr:FAD-dependent monooxygenase [Nocardia alba]TCJ93153.1 2-polyprenyl-6-methoxyphenol hydroxylase-like FAD-dependent oxidoreductase [Nocardia alba]
MSTAIVVGGGIGGMAAALALVRTGWAVQVLERAPEVAAVGSGISLWSNALRALDALGVGDTVRAQGMAEVSAGIRDDRGRWLSRTDLATLRERFGAPVVIHRARLLDILRAELPEGVVSTGVSVREVSLDGRVVHSAGTASADLIVGADGIYSVVRRAVCGEVAPRYAGYTAWRAVVDIAEPLTEFGETWGRGARFGMAPLADGRVYCFAVYDAPENAAGSLAEVRGRFDGWHHPISALLAAADPNTVLHNDIYDLPLLSTFTAGRIALLGDAAHAMTPNLGQGGCQALEDAVILARLASEPDGLARYDRERRPRTQMIVARSARIGTIAQLSARPLVTLRNAAVRLTPASAQLRSMAEILDWTC